MVTIMDVRPSEVQSCRGFNADHSVFTELPMIAAFAPPLPDVVLGQVGAKIASFVERWYPKHDEVYITSAYRKTEADGGTWSHHNGQTYQGSPTAAVDFGAWDFGQAEGSRRMRDLARWLYTNFGDLTVEMFHTTPYADDNGFNIRDQLPASGIAEHSNHIHYATSDALLDAMEARALALWGEQEQVQEKPGPVWDGTPMFGYDGSDFTRVMDFTGLSFVTHKITEAVAGAEVYTHERFGLVMRAARDQGIEFLGAYVVPRTGGYTPEEEAAIAVDAVNRQAPWLFQHPGFFWQVDLEKWPYDQVEANEGTSLANELHTLTGHPVIVYASRGQYGDSIPGGHPLWNANYPSDGGGSFKDLYPGNEGPGWAEYSGRVPLIWQYSDRATFADGQRGDANAFRGNASDFRRLVLGQTQTGTGTSGEEADMINGKLERGFMVDRTGEEERLDYRHETKTCYDSGQRAAYFSLVSRLTMNKDGTAEDVPVKVRVSVGDGARWITVGEYVVSAHGVHRITGQMPALANAWGWVVSLGRVRDADTDPRAAEVDVTYMIKTA